MRHGFSAYAIEVAFIICATIVGISVSVMPDSSNMSRLEVAALGKTTPVILAQYIPCPNRHCR
jgi:hypothetical protein